MKHVRKIFGLLASVAFVGVIYFIAFNSLDSVLEFVDRVKLIYTTWDFNIEIIDIIFHAAFCILSGLVLLLALVGIIVGLIKVKKNPNKTFVDFLTLLFVGVSVVLVSTRCFNSNDMITICVGLGLELLLVVYEIFALCDTKAQVCKVEEVPCEEELPQEEVVEEVIETPEEEETPCEEELPQDGLLGKTYTVVDGDNVLKLMVVGVNGRETKPVFSKAEEPAFVEEPVNEVNEPEENEEENEGGEKAKSLSYIERLAASDEELRNAYSTIKNQLLSHRKVHSRVSKSCETFRVGYDEVAKIVVAGKGLKLYLAMDPFSVDSAIYHQRDASSKKRFVAVPLVVKVKSSLSIKKACQLIDLTCEKKEVLPKSRYEEIDYSVIEITQ